MAMFITPFKSPQYRVQRNFNVIHARERCIIERIIRQLKKRFPILANCVRVSLERVPKVIVSCAVLHNVAKHLNDEFDFDAEENGQEVDDADIVGEQEDNRATKERGLQKRADIMQYLNEL